jgi:hypothetical protein
MGRSHFACALRLVGLALVVPSAALAQVQVNQQFNSQGPGPQFGNVKAIHSADASPNGTAAGAIQAVVADPALGANTLFAASPNGGIFVTNNGGTTWQALTDNQASLSISSMALDPTDRTGKTLVAGTGITDNGQYNAFNTGYQGRGALQTGLLYTTNGGASWSTLGGAALANQTVIGVVATGSTMLAATFEPQSTSVATTAAGASYGLYRSVDGGKTFNIVGAAQGVTVPGPASSLVTDPSNPSTIYAAISSPTTKNATSIFMSNNGGATWSPVFNQANSNGTISNANQTSITISTGPNGSLAAGVINDATNQLAGVFLSQDNGKTWHQLTAAPQVNPGSQAPVNFAIKIDPNNPNIVYISGDAYQSAATSRFTVEAFRINYDPTTFASTATSLTTQGTPPNFQDANTVHADSRVLTFDSQGRLILASDGGIYALPNPQGTGTWLGLNGNLSAYEAYAVAYDANSKRVVMAAQDNGAAYQAGTNNTLFNTLQAGDGVNAVVNDQTLNGMSLIYTSFQDLGAFARLAVDKNGNVISPPSPFAFFSGGVLITCDGGQSCASVVHGSYFLSPVVLNRINPTMMAIGGDRAYVTTDTNPTTAAAIDLTLTDVGAVGTNPAGNSQQITAMAYGARDNTTALLVGAGDRTGTGTTGTVFLSTTATANSLNPLGYAGLTPTSLVFDPRTYQRFYVADSANVWGTNNAGALITNTRDRAPT